MNKKKVIECINELPTTFESKGYSVDIMVNKAAV